MTTVTLLAGERSIGGTQIIVEDEGARLLFDCGLPFGPEPGTRGVPFAQVRRRTSQRNFADLLTLRLAPYIPDLYAPELVSGVPAGLTPDVPPASGPLAVALSHSHLDHTSLVGYVDPNVPIYASEPTARIVQVLSDVGAILHPLTRPLTAIPTGEPFTVGPMRVHLVPVDHDVCGACGLLIETENGVIAYSGDMRLHGQNPMRTLAFAQAARAAGARLLILEGTRLAPPPELEATGPAVIAYERVEADVAPDTVRALREIPGKLGVILLTPENGERIEALAGAVSEAGRLLVLDLEGLTFATAALGRPIAAPHAVYVPSDTALALESGREIAPSLSEALSAAPQVMSACEMAADPGAFLLRLGFERFADLVDLLPAVQGGIVISSNGPPLGPFDPAWAHMEWWAAHLGMSVIDVNCTGHASPRDLALIAAQSGAPTVMSIHSRHPELLPVAPERLLLPERGRPYRLSELGR